MSVQKIVVVGGVAGGASAAARARRLCERCEILVFDRGPHVSFANCGLPYFVGGVIEEEHKLLVASPESFRERFAIEVRTLTEVTAIDPLRKRITWRDLEREEQGEESYDALVLSPGASAIRPPLDGIDLPGIFELRTIPDSRRIRAWIDSHGAKRAVVVGCGFIGLEMAENLHHRGLEVAMVELADQVMPPLDPEMAVPIEEHLRERGIRLLLGDGVASFAPTERGLEVRTVSGKRLPADLVILAIGVRPQTELAKAAGLALGETGAIRVDASMRTSDPDIYAVGDAVEVRDIVLNRPVALPLAGPANRQGRICAEAIMGYPSRFRGVQGTAICGVFDLQVATCGASAKSLRRAGLQDRCTSIHLHPGHHVGYYPGARPIHLKLVFDTFDGRVLGAQAVGEEGVARRIDVVSMAIQMGATVEDLAESELCYAPQFGAAKDPLNLAGMIASNVRMGLQRVQDPADLVAGRKAPHPFILDVREPEELEEGALPHAVNVPLPQLRGRLDEIPRDREIAVYCATGQRSYYAVRILSQHGFQAVNISGGVVTYDTFARRERSGRPV